MALFITTITVCQVVTNEPYKYDNLDTLIVVHCNLDE